jgi:hypothetical protein
MTAFADVTSTRVTPYDWQCQDVNSQRISDHARFDTAFVACLNAPNGAFVQGGKYRIAKTAQPTPPPTPVPVLGTATFTWGTPTTNTDGSPLTNLVGYRVLFGNSPTNLNQSLGVGLVTRYVASNLTPGTYCFAAIALSPTEQGDPSDPVVCKVIA